MKIGGNPLNCSGCPGAIEPLNSRQHLRQVQLWEELREAEISSMQEIKIYLLCESLPENRFIYDLSSDYSTRGLRYYLKNELVGGADDSTLLDYLQMKGILIVDAAYCPVYNLKDWSNRRKATAICFQRHNFHKLYLNRNAPIITILPVNSSIDSIEQFPDISKRISGRFQFSRLQGLKKTINDLAD